MPNWKKTLQSYQKLTNQELHQNLIEIGVDQRKSAVRCIALLSESKRRNDYARRAYSSLAKYAFDVLKAPSISTAYRYADVAKNFRRCSMR